jgi:ubiquitin conjugation factor E4 B
MVGPKQRNLKVRDPEQYYFKPSVLLSDLMDIYINLKNMPSFHTAVARDGRSYKPYNFEHAAEIMVKTKMKSPDELKTWKKLTQTLALAKATEDQAEEDLGDVPDEFLDPIMATLMEEPVILPQSRITVDKSTIRSHLLSDPVDPFNRMPLKIEDVLPDTEMKAKIDKFKEEARKRKYDAMQAGSTSEGPAGDEMDVS